MARTTKAAVLDTELDIEEVAEVTEAELSDKQVINEAIGRVIESTGLDVQKNRYKAMRAIAFQAFSNAIADGTFDDLVTESIANIDNLPSGWEMERAEKTEEAPVKKVVKAKVAPAAKAPATAKATPAKAATPAKTPRRRPAR